MITTNKPNRLINEKSPYLLQHAYNPVDWYPWGNEAFNKAKEEDKPIFLSIGYSTCHWCHVMEQESFEDAEVAELLNQQYVSIKVDREERPDIDTVYMNVCQTLTGQGGWPMTIIMTHDKKPFFAGTYFPKTSKFGKNGLIDILQLISQKWESDKQTLISSGEEIVNIVSISYSDNITKTRMTKEFFHDARKAYKRNYDSDNGGFGNAPKFPAPHNLMFLMRYSVLEKDEIAMYMVEKTLEHMCKGGMFDHIGGGFSRYSTDDKWLVPHFEKMLYDNALLIIAYLEAYQTTGKTLYKNVVIKTLSYVMNEMTDKSGGFYSAQDADSEGIEGKYYVFTPNEIIKVLGEEDGKKFNKAYDITETGNFEGKNIPNLIKNKNFIEYIDMSSENTAKYKMMINKLYKYRKVRTNLRLDDKILTSWNALMTIAMAKAGLILEDNKYTKAAIKATDFLMNNLIDHKGNLYVMYRDGQASGNGYLDDYSYTVWALLTLYESTFNISYLNKAIFYAKRMTENFFDSDAGGFYLYSKDSEQLFMRPKETYDGALPSGNSVAGYVLTIIAKITAEQKWEELSYKQLCFLSESLKRYPAAYSFSMIAGILKLYPSKEIVIVTPDELSELSEIRELQSKNFMPNSIYIVKNPENSKTLSDIAPFTEAYNTIDKKTTYYLCQDNTCQAPSTNSEILTDFLTQ